MIKLFKILSICFCILFFGTTSRSQQLLPASTCGKLVRHADFKSEYVQPRNVDVWLPDGYSKSTKYAVLYMHDGQMLFDSSTTWNKQAWFVDTTVCRLIAENKIKNCIVVGIWNTPNRHAEYYPEKAYDLLSDKSQAEVGKYHSAEKILSDNYLKFIVKELKPFIDKNYCTRKGRSGTFVAGSSMGGLISMYAVCEYPEVFGGAACISTHWPGVMPSDVSEDAGISMPDAFLQYLDNNLPLPSKHKIYFDYGTEAIDSNYKQYQVRADKIIEERGYKRNVNLKTEEFAGKDHSEKSWGERLYIPLEFLLGK